MKQEKLLYTIYTTWLKIKPPSKFKSFSWIIISKFSPCNFLNLIHSPQKDFVIQEKSVNQTFCHKTLFTIYLHGHETDIPGEIDNICIILITLNDLRPLPEDLPVVNYRPSISSNPSVSVIAHVWKGRQVNEPHEMIRTTAMFLKQFKFCGFFTLLNFMIKWWINSV